MAEQLLFGIADRMIGTLGSLAAKEIGLLWGVKDEIESLRNTVSTIEDVLLDAEEKHAAGDRAVTRWLGRLQDAMFDADDLLDAVSTEALRREVMTRDKKAKQVRIFFSKSNQLAFRLQMAHKIKAMRERLDAIDADRQRFHLEVRHVEETRVGGNRESHGYVRAETVIGREDDKKAVITWLLDSNVEYNVLILPIVGIGGLGKTTLAQLIFNDDQIQKHFQLKMWVCVSDPFHVKNIVENILEAATKTKPEAVQMDTLVNYLRKEIDGKKYLLVLDDVWNEDHEKWSKLKEVLMGGAGGSRILVTTRAEKVASTIRRERVASIIKTVESYSLRGLDDGGSWSLFKQMAFENGQEPENSSIIKLGKEILQKCSGVPLAIRTIGTLLGSKNPETEWLSFKNNELSKMSDQNKTDILPTLKLSYDHLPSHLKHCFAYCRLFPKDCEIERSTLIQLWIAQGFVKLSDQKQCLEDVGNQYFMDLLWRSFFQEAKTDGFGIVYRCKMHGLMHDLAISVAGSMITILDAEERNVDEKTRHVSIVFPDEFSYINSLSRPSLRKASSIRTLLGHHHPILYYNHTWDESHCKAIFSSSKFLRVLDLQNGNFYFLPSSFGKLKHLRYLDLSGNYNLKKLPNSITRLQNLETLILSFCSKLEELPRDIKKLVNLRHLEIDHCDGLTYMPRGLGQLTNLQTLSNFVVDKDPLSRYSSGLRELNGLNNLRGELCIQNLRHGKDDVASECKAANLKGKKHLHGLDLEWSSEGGGRNDSDVNVDDEVLLEVLQPQPNLKELSLQGNFCSRLPSWFSSLTNLVRFSLIECMKCRYLPPLSQLPSLKYLNLFRLDALEYISDSNEFSSSSSASVPFFPSLEEISFWNCPNLKRWWRRRDSSVEVNSDTNNSVEITEHPLLPSFLCLSKIKIEDCPELELANDEDGMQWQGLKSLLSLEFSRLPKLVSLPLGLQHATTLQRLTISNCGNLTAIPGWIHNCTSLQELEIVGCSSLTSLPEGMCSLTSLQRLKIWFCPILLQRCVREAGEDWPKIAHIRELQLYPPPQQRKFRHPCIFDSP